MSDAHSSGAAAQAAEPTVAEPAPAPASAAAAAAAPASASAAAAAPAGRPYGAVLIAGTVSHSFTGRKEAPVVNDGVPEEHLWRFHSFAPLAGKRIVQVIAGCTAAHYIALDAEGGAWVWGRNERGQLGLGDTRNRYHPVRVEGLGRVAGAAAGRNHTLLLTASGEVWAAGDNRCGQLGIGRPVEVAGGQHLKFTRAVGLPAGAVSVAAGSEFSAAVAGGGALFCAGSQQYGQ